MDVNALWDCFCQSGKIEDYLNFKQKNNDNIDVPQAMGGCVQSNDSMADLSAAPKHVSRPEGCI